MCTLFCLAAFHGVIKTRLCDVWRPWLDQNTNKLRAEVRRLYATRSNMWRCPITTVLIHFRYCDVIQVEVGQFCKTKIVWCRIVSRITFRWLQIASFRRETCSTNMDAKLSQWEGKNRVIRAKAASPIAIFWLPTVNDGLVASQQNRGTPHHIKILSRLATTKSIYFDRVVGSRRLTKTVQDARKLHPIIRFCYDDLVGD